MRKLLLYLCPVVVFGYTIDFDTALLKTVERNKGLQAKKMDIEGAKKDFAIAQGFDYGSLLFEQNISRTNHAGYVFGMKLASREATFGDFGFDEFDMSGATNPLPIAPDNLNNPKARTNYETKLSYKVPLFTGFQIENGKKMAQLQILAQKAQYQYDEKRLTFEVLKAYNGAVAAKEFIKANQKAKEATAAFVVFAQELYKEGLVTSIDVKQAKVHDMGVDSSLIEAYNRYELALAYLRFLTADSELSDVSSFKSIQNPRLAKETLIQKSYQQRDDLLFMEYTTKTLQKNVALQEAYRYPTVGAQIEYGYNDNQLNNLDQSNDYYVAALGLSYTLFDGSINSAKVEKAKITFKKMQYNKAYMKDAIALEIEKNILTLEAKSKIFDQKVKANILFEEVLEQSQELYKNHLINMSNLLLQQANQQKANAEMILAQYEKSLAAGTLKISLGENL